MKRTHLRTAPHSNSKTKVLGVFRIRRVNIIRHPNGRVYKYFRDHVVAQVQVRRYEMKRKYFNAAALGYREALRLARAWRTAELRRICK